MQHRIGYRTLASICAVVVILFLSTLTSCAQSLPTVKIGIGSNRLTAELATTPKERERGLMFRTRMAENHGMLFIFPDDQQLSFWMKNTKIPLSIAFISSDGVIKKIADMQPESLNTTLSDYSVRYALEVNKGYFSRNGIAVGMKVRLPADLPRARN